MRKILMCAHVIDENGATVPGQIINVHDGAAERYVKNGWATFVEEEKIEAKAEEPAEEMTEESMEIEAPEDDLPGAETATLKRRGRPRKVV